MNLEVMTAGASIYADAAGADASLGLAARKLVGRITKMNLGFLLMLFTKF
jgi:hypothetical protein